LFLFIRNSAKVWNQLVSLPLQATRVHKHGSFSEEDRLPCID